jgi:hypothetical protein
VIAAAAGVAPVLLWNRAHGWAGVLHRLVWTQAGAGFSLRNLGALLGGQLLYVGPLMLLLLGLAVSTAVKRRTTGDQTATACRTLLAASLPTLGMTYLLVLWSDVAEPHWPAAGYLPLFPLAAGWVVAAGRRWVRLAWCAVGCGLIAFAALNVLVLTPLVPMVTPASRYEPRFDLSNELRGWPEVAEAIRKNHPTKKPVVAAFYTQCSQLTFALSRPDDPPVRCISPQTDDFDIWHGPFHMPATGALFVTDNRFDYRAEALLPGARPKTRTAVQIARGKTLVRRFEITDLKGP